MSLISFVEDTEPSHDASTRWTAKEPSDIPEQKPKKDKISKKEDITSLTFDQVNDNADELIELRGEGRYFGVTDPSTGQTINAQQSLGPLCDNCHKRGHHRSKCKTVVCHKCGVVGDHYETHCPTTTICSKCGLRGHMMSACTSKSRKRQYCKSCDTFEHGDENCPSIWRSYITKVKDQEHVLPVVYCYNCGDDSHYGDECDSARSSRIPNRNGSAFSGTNLPKHLRNFYFDRIADKPKTNNYGSYNNGYNNSYSGYNSSYNNSNYNNNNYNSNYGGGNFHNSGYNNLNGRNFNNNKAGKPSSKNYSSNDGRNFTAENMQPSRSGFISTKTNGKKPNLPSKPTANRTGYILSKVTKASVKPIRSGVLLKSKKPRNNIQVLY